MFEADSEHPWLVLACQGGTLPRHCSPQLCRLYFFQSLIGVLLSPRGRKYPKSELSFIGQPGPGNSGCSLFRGNQVLNPDFAGNAGLMPYV